MVGMLLGPHPVYLTPGHARELVLLPGTILYRLLVDPADGRIIERTLKPYKPDADMRRQILAADLFSRAPGSRLTGRSLELHHVTPYSTGGYTSEAILAALDKRTHHAKTIRNWTITIGTRRDMKFITLLGQTRTTRVHDYGQYFRELALDDLEQRKYDPARVARDRASRALYADLADTYRQAAHPNGRGPGGLPTDITLTRTDPDTGRTSHGPHPNTPTLEQLLGIPSSD